MANILEFRKDISDQDLGVTGVAPLDGEQILAKPLELPLNSKPKMQVCAITLSDRIPNIFNAAPYYNWNNTRLAVHTNVVGSLFYINLTRGRYAATDQIAAAINQAIVDSHPTWYTNPLQPALAIDANPVINAVIVTIDSTKMAAPHTTLTLDLSKATSGTDLATTLGFSQATSVMTSAPGVISRWTSDQIVRMDTQGTTCDVQCSLISSRRRNGTWVKTLALIPFAGKTTISDNVWPTAGQISPIMIYDGGRVVGQVNIEIKTMTGNPMLFMDGAIHMVLSFVY
jgi:hypothetical protein